MERVSIAVGSQVSSSSRATRRSTDSTRLGSQKLQIRPRVSRRQAGSGISGVRACGPGRVARETRRIRNVQRLHIT